MVRKSWLEDQVEAIFLSRLPAARRAAEQVVADVLAELEPEQLPPEPVPVQVSKAEYAAWYRVEDVRARYPIETPFDPVEEPKRLAELLIDEFGSKDAVRDALLAYRQLEERLDVEASKRGKPVYPELAPSVVKELTAKFKPRRLPPLEIVRYSAQRAWKLGFTPAAIWSKGQGQRASEAEKAARAQIVVELRDKGATLADIGAIFGGRNKASVSELVAAGRQAKKGKHHG